MKVENERSDWVDIERGEKQGCVLSPDLFSMYTQIVMEELAEVEGVSIGGRNVNNIRYADDMVLIADSEGKLQRLIDEPQDKCLEKGLRINRSKTEVMGITKRNELLPVNVTMEGIQITQ